MSFDTDLKTFVLADAAVAALVGTNMFPVIATEEQTGNYITYQIVGSEHWHSLDGRSGLAKKRVQFNSWANSVLGTEAINEALRLRLDSFRGTMGSTKVQFAKLVEEIDAFEQGPLIYRCMSEYQIWHEET